MPNPNAPEAGRRLLDGEAAVPQKREATISVKVVAVNTDARTVELSFSSETPVDRWFGKEILSHDPGAADLRRLNDGGNLLWNHDPSDVLGVIERAWIGDDRKGHAIVRFGKDERGTWAMNQVADGVLRNVSFMYLARDYICEAADPDRYSPDDVYTARQWEAFEISLLTIAADPSVGVGRSAEEQLTQTRVHVVTQARTQPSAAADQPSEEETEMKRKHARLMDKVGEGSTGGGTVPAAPAAPAAHDPAQLRRDEIARQAGIRKLGERWGKPELADLHIEGGSSLEAARSAFMDALDKENTTKPVGARVDMSTQERKRYSLVNAIRAIHKNDWKEAGFEREVSEEIAKQMQRDAATGFFVPTDLPFAPDEAHARAWVQAAGGSKLAQRAPFAVGAANTGGALVGTTLMSDNWIEVLRNVMVTPTLGARFLTGLVGKVDIPRQITAAATSWVGELTPGTESEATFDKVSLSPKNITSWGVISRLMMLQSTPAIEMIARADLVAQLALGLDLAALIGTGTGGQPLGITNQSGVASVIGGANGANLTFDHLIQMIAAPKVANAPQSNMGFAMNAKAQGYLSTLKSTTGQYLWDPQGGLTNNSPDKIKGHPYAISNQMRSNLTKGTANGICSELIFGNWLELLIAEWGALEIAINPYDSTLFKSGDVVIRAIQTADVGVRHGASFSVMSDALTPGF
ncbi:phage major capsid protein [Ideonella paludis]|uniref:Phage major capsid protein n=2 Tax=Ideonella paludis TaxID=1233411 RepID=A0ABS5DU32_9BURK|nr:phage major capsid protein [Ideonella paludis]MBQ0934645.1 phage major capsid protein [Ideonella paludis]